MSIAGFFYVFLAARDQAIIALLVFIVFLLLIFVRIFYVSRSFLAQRTEDGYDRLATMAKFHCSDGKMVLYDLHKFIQCKQIMMAKHEHEFRWTGSSDPKISSDTMNYEGPQPGEKGFTRAIFRFKKPLLYNDVFVVHIRMEIDDTDKKSKPYLQHWVHDPVQMITFRVELPYKTGRVQDARLLFREIGKEHEEYKFIRGVPFDKKTSSYEYAVYNPQVNHCYMIEWVK